MTFWTLFPNSKGKSGGPNGLVMESFIYACPELFVHLSLFFSSCVNDGFLPNKFSEVIITPLVKNKGDDLTYANNYCAIALSNVDTKIVLLLMLPQITTFHSTSDSTSQCAGAVKEVVNYYVSKNSHVFACFIDITKAFDKSQILETF